MASSSHQLALNSSFGPIRITLKPHLIAYLILAIAIPTIIAALLLTHFYPGRFHIHPYPYLSDAGIRDPERIVLSIGLSISAALFVPLVAAHHLFIKSSVAPTARLRLPILRLSLNLYPLLCRAALPSGLAVALFLLLFASVPGIWILHHIFSALFAVSALLWSCIHALLTHALARPHKCSSLQRLQYLLCAAQALVVVIFAFLWASVRLRLPPPVSRNNDPRFVVMALLEYVGISAFLACIAIVAHYIREANVDVKLAKSSVNARSRPNNNPFDAI